MALALTRGMVIAGRYRLEEVLGQGGMGLVWKAIHLVTHRRVALKVLSGALVERAEMKRRFLREARAASAVMHPNVVEIYDVFELDDATPVMVMPLLLGETFGQKLARETALALDEAADILLQVVSAAGTAHALGIIHRDLKPDNVFLAIDDQRRVVKVLDFGIAKFSPGAGHGDAALTTTGTTFGTPCYMAPEQAFGESDVDHLADVWSIGAMLYEALVGGRPIEGDNSGQVLKNLMTRAITPIALVAPHLPADLTSLVMRMLTRDRTARPRDLREVHRVLSRFARISAPEFGAPASPGATTDDTASTTSAPKVDGPSTTLESGTPVGSLERGWSARTPSSGATSPWSLRSKRGWLLAATAFAFGVAVLVSWRARVRVTAPAPVTSHVASADDTLAPAQVPSVVATEPRSLAASQPTDSVGGLAPAAPSAPRAEGSARRGPTTTRSKSRTLSIDTASPY